MPHGEALLLLFANLGIFFAFAARKHAYSPTGIVPLSSQTDHVAALEAEIEQLKGLLSDARSDNARSPWSKVQIWGWISELADTDERKIWGLTDSSGYLPQELQKEDPKLQIEMTGFSTFLEYETWLSQNCQFYGGDVHTDLYSPFVVVDGTYVGGYQGFTKAIADNYPDFSEATVGPIG